MGGKSATGIVGAAVEAAVFAGASIELWHTLKTFQELERLRKLNNLIVIHRGLEDREIRVGIPIIDITALAV